MPCGAYRLIYCVKKFCFRASKESIFEFSVVFICRLLRVVVGGGDRSEHRSLIQITQTFIKLNFRSSNLHIKYPRKSVCNDSPFQMCGLRSVGKFKMYGLQTGVLLWQGSSENSLEERSQSGM